MKHSRIQSRRRHARGLTLIELVVVLTILTVLGVAVVANTTRLAADARSEVTTSTVDAVYSGVVGREPLAFEDPTAVLPGFISDIGRLPLVNQVLVDRVRDDFGNFGDDVAVPTPGELWDHDPPGVAPLPLFAPRSHASDPDFEFSTGWRGPYANLRTGALALNGLTGDQAALDGIRRRFAIFPTDGTLATAGEEFAGLLGSTDINTLSTSWAFGNDDAVGFILRDDSSPATPDRTRGTVQFDLDPSGTEPGLDDIDEMSDEMVVVRLYGPEDGLPQLLAQWPRAGQPLPASPRGLQTFEDDAGNPVQITIGVRYLRIYRWNSDTAPPTTTVMSGPGAAPEVEGAPGTVRFTVLPGGPGSSVPRLEIPPVP
jgi:prepilin-type N-terminal cleavage/methylation domain-containing protein